jgi:tetratricopeptide (TPR) repeat protein
MLFRHIRIIFISMLMLLGAAYAQKEGPNELYRQAYELERKAEYASAEEIYRQLHEAYPQNYNYFTRYKQVLTRQRKRESLVPLLEKMLEQRSYDAYLRIELGILYYSFGRKVEARKQWQQAFRGKNESILNNYASFIYQIMNDHGLNHQLTGVSNEIRSLTGIPDLLARHVFIHQMNYQEWDAALEELRLLIGGNAAELRQAKSALFDLDTGLPIFRMIPPFLKDMDSERSKLFLSDLYVYLQQPDSAISVLRSDTGSQVLLQAMRDLASGLYRSGNYPSASRAAMYAAKYSHSDELRNRMLLLSAQAGIDNYLSRQKDFSRIPEPYPSQLSRIPFPAFHDADPGLINEALRLLDSLAVTAGPIGVRARYYRAEIYYLVLQDIDRALEAYRELADRVPEDLKIPVLSRIAGCYQARGEFKRAMEFLENAPGKYALMVHEEDLLSPRLLRARFLAEGPDSLYEKSRRILAVLPEKDEMYNEVVSYAALISDAAKDTVNTQRWLEAERLMVRNKIAEAARQYEHLLSVTKGEPILYALRYLQCLNLLEHNEKELDFWEGYYHQLKDGPSGDYFMLRYAEYCEKMQNHQKAIEIYEEYLLSYQESMYYDMVRQYMRERNTSGAP